ncbi:hypothetical protein [Photobacterium kishitanii]|uniref:hypothetical protein n=1 Tax=Photobacterium kishitanii TaxID=318456 RepID=UPI001EFDA05B|nr:hypothetical protein [Photobacterium kishitanii]
MNKDKALRCIQDFFEEEHVKEVISTIKECRVSGWEGWIQVEFAHYLQKKYTKIKKRISLGIASIKYIHQEIIISFLIFGYRQMKMK